MPDYSKMMMYKIVCKDLTVKSGYVGSSRQLVKRKNNHKTRCNNPNDKKHNLLIYKTIRDNGGWDNWSLIKIEDFPDCKDGTHARMRERELYEELFEEKLNMVRPSITDDERIIYKNNHNANRDPTIHQCNCGGTFTYTRKASHLKTKMHQKYLEDNPTN